MVGYCYDYESGISSSSREILPSGISTDIIAEHFVDTVMLFRLTAMILGGVNTDDTFGPIIAIVVVAVADVANSIL